MIRSKESQINAKLSSYLMMIVIVVIVLAVVALLIAGTLLITGNSTASFLFAVIGALALGTSGSVLYQNRRRTVAMKNEPPKVMTTIECKKCGTKNVREHQRGDFVFKEVGACQKCSDQQLITAIFKTVTEKEKTYAV